MCQSTQIEVYIRYFVATIWELPDTFELHGTLKKPNLKKLFLLLLPLFAFGQVRLPSPNDYYKPINTNPNINTPQVPTMDIFRRDEQQRTQQQNQQIINETQKRENQREQQMREVYTDINKSKSNINYNLPSNSDKPGTEYYRDVFDKMQILDETNYSIKDINFQIENAFLKKKITTYEIELKKYNRLINNRNTVKQLFLILCDITGAKTDLMILKNIDIQNQLKYELIQDVLKIELNNIDAGVNCFNYLYKKQTTIEVKPIKDLTDNFDTNLNNSLFNQLSIEEANNRGETFFKEYLKFIKIVEVKELKPLTKKQVYHLPELDFDFL